MSTVSETREIVFTIRTTSERDAAEVAAAVEALAEVMLVQAEDGLWTQGYPESETEPNEYVGSVDSIAYHIRPTA